MKEWIIPVSWEVSGTIKVNAGTLEDAIEYAEDKDALTSTVSDEGYVEGSWKVDELDPEYIRNAYNNGQKDDTDFCQQPNCVQSLDDGVVHGSYAVCATYNDEKFSAVYLYDTISEAKNALKEMWSMVCGEDVSGERICRMAEDGTHAGVWLVFDDGDDLVKIEDYRIGNVYL